MIRPISLRKQPLLDFEQYRLANGLTVLLHADPSAPDAAVVVMYHVGSKDERPGRTGFAHLFEHVMFKGSKHVADGEHFRLLQEIGANVNGTTSEDRTNYFEVVPGSHLELALYLESDRMGFLAPVVDQAKLDNQRDVVKNERRQNYDNQPYGTAQEKISRALFAPPHPYGWPVIGSMADLSAASLDDVRRFLLAYYVPNNACLAISGNFDTARTKGWIEQYFGPIPAGSDIPRPDIPADPLSNDTRLLFQDRVQLPRLYMTWPSARLNTRADAVLDVLASILGRGMNARLHKSLVYEDQIAQSVSASQDGMEVGGTLQLTITARPGRSLTEMESATSRELARLLTDGVSVREVETALNNKESHLVSLLSSALGRANALATAFTLTGDAENINKELQRYEGMSPAEVLASARSVLPGPRVWLSVVPEGKPGLAAELTPPPRPELAQ